MTTVDVSLAFGDSITYGTTCRPSTSTGVACDVRINWVSWPASSPVGRSLPDPDDHGHRRRRPWGVRVDLGLQRDVRRALPSARNAPPAQDVVVILEGVNDLNNGRSA